MRLNKCDKKATTMVRVTPYAFAMLCDGCAHKVTQRKLNWANV